MTKKSTKKKTPLGAFNNKGAKTEKNMKTISKKTLLFFAATALMAACASEDIEKQEHTGKQRLTTFQSGNVSPTRTTMEHTIGGKGKFFWETGDKIWINAGATPISNTSSNITGKTNRAQFYFSSTLSGASYLVTYTGKGSTQGDAVTIAATQTQNAPNNTEHLGTSGDCGTATAHRDIHGIYNFELEHKVAYLCFQPRSTDAFVKRSKLIKIEVTSDQNLAGTYSLGVTGLSASPTSGASKTIVLNTNHFLLDNATADLDKNGSYITLAPGLHHLTIYYWLRNTTDYTDMNVWPNVKKPIEGFIPQQLTINVEAGKIYDITANLKIPSYKGIVYGEEPEAANTANNPNINECSWLASNGNPLWSDKMLWVRDHTDLFQGGMWFKKLSTIAAEQGKPEAYYKTIASDGNNYLTTEPSSPWMRSATEGFPQKLDDYFFLPATGVASGGPSLSSVQMVGYYWTSTEAPSWSPSWHNWYYMYFDKTNVYIKKETLLYQYTYSLEWTPQ